MTATQLFGKYYISGKSVNGKCRDHNEDRISINCQAGLILVADGMGGHLHGERASAEAISLINQLFETHLPLIEKKWDLNYFWRKLLTLITFGSYGNNLAYQQQIIRKILIETNKAIHAINRKEAFQDGSGMGTTLVGCRFFENPPRMLAFHVGDSRLYRLRNKQLLPVTKDHSLYQLWLDSGQIGKKPGSNVILQGLGPDPQIIPEIQLLKVAPGDAFLLCSDGLNDMLSDDSMEDILQNLTAATLEAKLNQLIDAANDSGGLDNISAILICQ
jgi:PPM family protein phosphatase